MSAFKAHWHKHPRTTRGSVGPPLGQDSAKTRTGGAREREIQGRTLRFATATGDRGGPDRQSALAQQIRRRAVRVVITVSTSLPPGSHDRVYSAQILETMIVKKSFEYPWIKLTPVLCCRLPSKAFKGSRTTLLAGPGHH
jgi:hypothetical protein